MTSGSQSRRVPRPQRGTPPAPPRRGPAPIERGRALGVVAGLLAFTAGFAMAGVLVLLGRGGTPPYVVGVSLGLVGVGVVGFYYQRGAAQLPQAKLWSPELLRAVIVPLNLPPVPVIAVIYLLGAIGVVGNLLVPLSRR